MIDTIHFKVGLGEELYERLIKVLRGVRFRVVNDNKMTRFAKTKTNITIKSDDIVLNPEVSKERTNLGSWAYGINVDFSNFVMELEFSVPKVLYGHNSYEVTNINELHKALDIVQQKLWELDKEIPPYKEWFITRLDICSNEECVDHEEVLKKKARYSLIDFKNFTKTPYNKKNNQGVQWVGTDYTLKFYSKYEEFMKHDRKHIDYDDNFLDYVNKILRFEVTMRQGILNYLFGKKLYIEDIKFDKIGLLLNGYKENLTKTKVNMMGLFEVKDKLFSKYDKSLARQLYMFYQVYYSGNPVDKQTMKDCYSKSQIFRNIQLIKEANCGLRLDNKKIKGLEEQESLVLKQKQLI